MNEQIVPRFKRGEFSSGITAGCEGLERMARGLTPAQLTTLAVGSVGAQSQSQWWYWPSIIGGAVLVILAAISLGRSGNTGWAWVVGAVILSFIAAWIYSWITGRGFSDDTFDGGYSGGSFGGGGFSGGGGATGSW